MQECPHLHQRGQASVVEPRGGAQRQLEEGAAALYGVEAALGDHVGRRDFGGGVGNHLSEEGREEDTYVIQWSDAGRI